MCLLANRALKQTKTYYEKWLSRNSRIMLCTRTKSGRTTKLHMQRDLHIGSELRNPVELQICALQSFSSIVKHPLLP